MKKLPIKKLLPIFYCFAIMGFIDIVAIATSYVKQDFDLSDKFANLIPSMALIWFILISMPTSIAMGRIGRKVTVLASLAIMTTAMLIPSFTYSFPAMLLSFALLGIGNTILQVSLNPLLGNIVSADKMTSSISFGQFVKSIISLLGPILIGLFASQYGNWRLVFLLYASATVLAFIWLLFTSVPKEKYEVQSGNWSAILSLLKDRYIVVCFSIIVLTVGFEISLMTVVPKYLLESCNMPLESSGLACSLFYAAKTVATFAGAIILARVSSIRFLIVSLVVAIVSFVGFAIVENPWSIMVNLTIIGLAMANVFAIVLSMAMQYRADHANHVSALMIMGIAGGALLPPIMGVLADMSTQQISLAVPMIALAVILFASAKWLKKR